LSHAGFRNVVTETNALGLVYPGIEGVIAMRPDLMVIGAYRPGQPSQASALLEHPALRLYRTRYASELYLPGREWSCSTRFLASTAARLAAMRDDMQQSAKKDDAE